MKRNRTNGEFQHTWSVLTALVFSTAVCLGSAGCQSDRAHSARGGSMRQVAQTRITTFLAPNSTAAKAPEPPAQHKVDPLPEPPYHNEFDDEPTQVPPVVDLSDRFPETTDPTVPRLSSAKPESKQVDDVDAPPEPALPQTFAEAVQFLTKLGAGISRDYDGVVRSVDIAYLNFTDEHARLLPLLAGITELDLTGTEISDAALRKVGDLTSLQSLKLKGTLISDAGMPHIGKLTQLRILDLGRTQVTDSALLHFTTLKELHYLVLDHTAVSDAGIVHLKSLQTLRGINLIDSRVTADGLSRLEKELPRCLIVTQTGDDISFLHLPAEFSLTANSSTPRTGSDEVTDPQLRRLLQLAHQDPELAVHVASVYSDKGEWSKSAAILQVAARFRPNDERLHFRLAESLAYAGQTEEAYEIFRRFVGEAAANYAVGTIVYEKALKTSESFLERCVAIDPAHAKARRRLDEVQGRKRSIVQDSVRSDAVSTVSLPRILPKAQISSAPKPLQPVRQSPF